jgi:hypothetical protein
MGVTRRNRFRPDSLPVNTTPLHLLPLDSLVFFPRFQTYVSESIRIVTKVRGLNGHALMVAITDRLKKFKVHGEYFKKQKGREFNTK